jgi:hypothetical protein
MSLQHEPDVSKAAWFAHANDSWSQLCSQGPRGFAQYARLFHVSDWDEDNPADPQVLLNLEGDLDANSLSALTNLLAQHTSTPQDCFFGLWEGFGEIYGGVLVGGTSHKLPPAFAPPILEGPRVQLPSRSFILFRGPVGQAGQWGAAELMPGRPRVINSPSLMWPADHAWFVASEIDLPWTGIAGSAELINGLISDGSLDAERWEPTEDPPYWRT